MPYLFDIICAMLIRLLRLLSALIRLITTRHFFFHFML